MGGRAHALKVAATATMLGGAGPASVWQALLSRAGCPEVSAARAQLGAHWPLVRAPCMSCRILFVGMEGMHVEREHQETADLTLDFFLARDQKAPPLCPRHQHSWDFLRWPGEVAEASHPLLPPQALAVLWRLHPPCPWGPTTRHVGRCSLPPGRRAWSQML